MIATAFRRFVRLHVTRRFTNTELERDFLLAYRSVGVRFVTVATMLAAA
jgi:hypothetical protein